ncbi:TetR family transcriptional regulator [Mycolicibacterium canariasense]|uniref:TetR family transcriptional regulator n=1 Tax=Mycolicibacterium canariasense TaxID=228230 RepID=A0A124E2R5_MYCCR|nr:TetR/AcrR family transcriptional regulator [Mycolicibacterium canariasense]MCV7209625.1 TetR/AcrR family transcriptional regulator [Mycolicibacterium canariasense]ORU99550.1 TetR family transcriptional regulator [Mycolicibacterium canariasense]GAS97638.1 TetR family transcriptional regulator [Mycolicibacterium canariasense]
MAIEDRRERERQARRRLIVATARTLAEAEGWDAVTTRRLSTEIEYSQPVLYKHFAGMEQIAEAVALDGFDELAQALRATRADAGTADAALTRIAQAYLGFAHEHPAVYDAMFTRATTLRFAAEDTPPPLAAAFAELRRAVAGVVGEPDADTLTEVFWAALHGLLTLTRTGRLRPGHDDERLRLLIEQFGARVGS